MASRAGTWDAGFRSGYWSQLPHTRREAAAGVARAWAPAAGTGHGTEFLAVRLTLLVLNIVATWGVSHRSQALICPAVLSNASFLKKKMRIID